MATIRVLVLGALVALVACGSPTAARTTLSDQASTATVSKTTAEPSTTTSTTSMSTTTTEPAGATATATTTTIASPATTLPPPTTAAPTTTTVAESPVATGTGELLASDTLLLIVVENEHRGGYVRDLFGYPADLDGNGCDTRSEVLQRDSITPAQVDPFGCAVVQGDWISPYDGLVTTNPGDLQIDHVVPLKEAWDSGAWAWNGAALVAYANDLSDRRGLRAVSSTTNLSKGDKDPSNWLPPDDGAACAYLGDWVAIKARWHLTMDESEYGRIRNLLNGPCSGWRIGLLPPLPTSIAPSPPVAVPLATEPANTDVYYKNCTAVRAAGAAPLHIGEPGYRTALDGDKDGVACES